MSRPQIREGSPDGSLACFPVHCLDGCGHKQTGWTQEQLAEKTEISEDKDIAYNLYLLEKDLVQSVTEKIHEHFENARV